ncbi:hypothetical protein FNW02_37980 [Komarekiella sp. 'clone 1']|uniref:Uncharacterized protein n=1 Tax=Komarekiella delphini-convector SJRDD-AB1 TaxID=2593771 RepID=A0AA40VVZ2_9NOST|nr:hypothetical protein [Komarekiella delphini-convector]MBD6621321.1 hypothetical protein [Komarekiella delphini-convector SJRDD-AB1]
MSERGEIYNHNGKATAASLESRDLAQRFAAAIGEFNWRIDYVKFCELLKLEPGDYADQQYSYFQQLAESLTRFNAESLALMIDAGLGSE